MSHCYSLCLCQSYSPSSIWLFVVLKNELDGFFLRHAFGDQLVDGFGHGFLGFDAGDMLHQIGQVEVFDVVGVQGECFGHGVLVVLGLRVGIPTVGRGNRLFFSIDAGIS